jgi:DnaD/phage-associated family protein
VTGERLESGESLPGEAAPTVEEGDPRSDDHRGVPPQARWTPVPDVFFSRFLPAVDNGVDLKVFLHLLWRIQRRPRGTPPAMRAMDLAADPTLRRGLAALGVGEIDLEAAIRDSAAELEGGGLVLEAAPAGGAAVWLFVNTPEGRVAHAKAMAGELALPKGQVLPVPEYAPADGEPPTNIFTLYEENVGAVTPLLAEELKEAQAIYPDRWVEDAFRIALERNVRKWVYIRAILERWMREGRDDGAHREGGEGGRSRYLKGKYGDFVQH